MTKQKEVTAKVEEILGIDREQFVKSAMIAQGAFSNNNKLTQEHIEKIVAAYANRETVEYFTKLVPNGEIAAQGYNLSVSTYVEQQDTREVINITELNVEIERIIKRSDVLRNEIDKIVAEIEGNK